MISIKFFLYIPFKKINNELNRIMNGIICLSLIFFNCKKKIANEDIQDCDKISNYYNNGIHYIRRDLINDEGVWDYKKLLEDSKIKRSDCYPAKNIELNDKVD